MAIAFDQLRILYNIGYIKHMGTTMAKGDSGRIVVEIDPALKRRLYSSLAMESRTLKEWFVAQVQDYLDRSQRNADRSKNESGG